MTVSRVINGHQNVRRETREKVLKAIAELSYYPNAAARALNRNRASLVEALVPYGDYFFSSEYFTELLFGIESVTRERAHHLIFNTYDPEGHVDYASLYKQRKVDGLLIVAPSEHDARLERLGGEGIPVVLINDRRDRAGLNYVDVDNEAGARLGMRHLFELGHRRIGILTGNMLVTNARHRLRGYLDALESQGIVAEEELIYRGTWSEQSGYEGFGHFHKLAASPTALFCCNDLMAIGVMRAALDNGLEIPRDISVIGFDDIRLASYVSPRLTTVRQPIAAVGRTAAGILIDLLDGCPGESRQVILQPELIVRDSCDRPRREQEP